MTSSVVKRLNDPQETKAANGFLKRLTGRGSDRAIKMRFYLSVFCAGLSALASIGQCWLLARLLASAILEHKAWSAYMGDLALLLVVFLGKSGFDGLRHITNFDLAADIRQTLRRDLLQKIAGLGPQFTRGEKSGALSTTLSTGIDALEAYFSGYLPQRLISALVPLIILLVVFPVDYVSGIILLITAPLIPLFMIVVGKGAEALNRRQWMRLSLLAAHFFDIIAGLTTLIQTGAAKRQAHIIDIMAQNYRHATMNVLRVAFLSALVLEFFATIATAMVAVYIGFRLYYGQMDFQTGLFALLLAPEFFRPLRDLGAHYHARMEAMGAAIAIQDILQQDIAEPQQKAAFIGPVKNIAFHNVHFAHDDEDNTQQAGVHNISFSLNSGQSMAILGPSGAGKTTLSQLLLGLYQPRQGQILINGQDLQTIDKAQFYQEVGWLAQDPAYFAGSLVDNIRLGRETIRDDDIAAMLKDCDADTFVNALPNGLLHHIGDRGRGLSGGQRRRIALVRALVGQPSLIVLDEPTAGLDKAAAERVMDVIFKKKPQAICLIITHDRALAQRADLCFELKRGQLHAFSPQEERGA